MIGGRFRYGWVLLAVLFIGAPRVPSAQENEISLPESPIPTVKVVDIAPAGFDVYVVDREFGGDSRGHDVIGRIRALEPQSLVLAYSAYLDRDFLRALLREGCEGAFDKGNLEELDAMIAIIGEFVSGGRRGAAGAGGIGGTVRAISSLVREWNLRLAERGRADAKVCGDA